MKKSTQMLLAGASMAFALNAYAAPVTHVTAPIQTATVVDIESYDDGITTIDLTKFNAGLGQLQSVKVELFSTLNGAMLVENTSANSGLSYTQWVSSDVTLLVNEATSLTASGNYSHAFSLGQYDHSTDYAGTSGATHSYSFLGYQVAVFSDTDTLQAFSGPGTLQAFVSGSSNSWGMIQNGNQDIQLPTQIDTYAKVTYTYTTLPVPEPETYAMLLAGLGLMGVVARSRKSA